MGVYPFRLWILLSTPLKLFLSTLDYSPWTYRTPNFTPIQSKKLGRPCVNISLQFAFCSFASTRLYLHFWKIQLIWKTQPTDGTRPLRKEQGYKYYLSLYIYYFNFFLHIFGPISKKNSVLDIKIKFPVV